MLDIAVMMESTEHKFNVLIQQSLHKIENIKESMLPYLHLLQEMTDLKHSDSRSMVEYSID